MSLIKKALLKDRFKNIEKIIPPTKNFVCFNGKWQEGNLYDGAKEDISDLSEIIDAFDTGRVIINEANTSNLMIGYTYSTVDINNVASMQYIIKTAFNNYTFANPIE